MDAAIVKDFARLRVLQKSASEHKRDLDADSCGGGGGEGTGDGAPSEEEKPASANDSVVTPSFPRPAGTPSRRRAWRRRCKSTSNLSAALRGASSSTPGGAQMSDDSTTSSDDEGGLSHHAGPGAPLSSRDRGGTSSLQLSDSDDDMGPPSMVIRAKEHTQRKKRRSLEGTKGGSDQGCTTTIAPSGPNRHSFPAESDSVTETGAAHSVRPNTKRKRKCKRMALDPTPNDQQQTQQNAGVNSFGKSVGKRQRSRHDLPAAAHATSSNRLRSQALPSIGIVAGKRKRSNREKSVEPEHLLAAANQSRFSSAHARDIDAMECDDDGDDHASSSSLSTTEWEEDEDSDNPTSLKNSREADDEQSDWPGHNEWGAGGGGALLTDDDGEDLLAANFLSEAAPEGSSQSSPMTATARQTYLARMKRLAECVPGREIRAGARK